jgi:hypothetical protein
MSNEYYDHTTYPTPNSPGSSAALRAELDQIEAGFNKLPTLAANGNKVVIVNSSGTALTATSSLQSLTITGSTISGSTLSSPALTGVPTAPTASTGTATTQLATTAFVAAAAFSAALPGQSGNAGKFVTTDGTNASWAEVYPSQTGNSGKFLTTNGTAASWADIPPANQLPLLALGII